MGIGGLCHLAHTKVETFREQEVQQSNFVDSSGAMQTKCALGVSLRLGLLVQQTFALIRAMIRFRNWPDLCKPGNRRLNTQLKQKKLEPRTPKRLQIMSILAWFPISPVTPQADGMRLPCSTEWKVNPGKDFSIKSKKC